MHRDFMYALPELGIFIGHEHGADAPVLRSPCTSAIVGAVDAPSRDRHIHPLVIARIKQNSVQGESPIARHPARTMWVIEETTHQRPRFPGVAGFEKRRGFHAAVEHVRFIWSSQR